MAQDVGRFDETTLFRGENANVRNTTPLFRRQRIDIKVLCLGREGRVQTALPQRFPHHGLRGLRQMQIVGQGSNVRCWYGVEGTLRAR